MIRLATALALACLPAAAFAQAPAPAATTPVAAPRAILFVGNSFTQGANSAARNWAADSVTDLTGGRIGGVPALFKRFADQVGMNFQVSHATRGGSTLALHLADRRALIDRAWDVVVLQEYSTLDPKQPGDSNGFLRDIPIMAQLVAGRNPYVRLYLMATWSRADQVYRGSGPWSGKPVTTMADDLRAAADRARAATPQVTGVIPVGQAWNRAFATGVADPDPYDGTAYGQLNLWSFDHYHASFAGTYLEALVVFGQITGVDPTRLGPGETAAGELGLSREQAAALQQVARDQLAAEAKP